MAKTDTDKVVEQLGGMTVLELVELKNKLEEEWGVTAAAPGAGGVRRRAYGRRRPEDPGDQGRPRRHGPRPERGEGPRRRRAQPGQGGRAAGRGRLDQGAAGRGRRHGRGQVSTDAQRKRRRGRPQGGPSDVVKRL